MKNMKNFKFLLVFLLILSISLFTLGCGKQNGSTSSRDMETIKIYTTFYPLYDFTKKIVQDKAEVVNLTPAGVEPHDFELSPKQVAKLYDADIFIFLGDAMEPWAKKLQNQLSSKGITVIEVGEGLIQDDDPHIWLDPILAKEMAQRIYYGVISVDRDGEDFYTQNLEGVLNKLDELDQSFAKAFSPGEKGKIITDHAILGYLAKRYNFEARAITGLSPQEEPTPKTLAELATFCKTNDIKYIFTQRGESTKLSETLAHEVEAQILELNPLESLRQEDIDKKEDYFSIMEKNLANLQRAMKKDE